MKVRFKDRQNFKNLEDYLVIGFGFDENNSRFYFIADDNFYIHRIFSLEDNIIDDSLADYIRRDNLNGGREFYLENAINDLRKDLIDYDYINNPYYDHINNPYKNFKYFENKGYPISEDYERRILNEQAKLDRIEGFLMFANRYLLVNFGRASYSEGFEFFKGNSLDYLLEKKTKEPYYLPVIYYESELKEFIEKLLNEQEKRNYYADMLAGLIKAIFLRDITSVQKIKTFYYDCFVIEYENNFYSLCKYWTS